MQKYLLKIITSFDSAINEYSEKILLSLAVLLISIFFGWLFSHTFAKIGKNKAIKKNRVYKLIANSINTIITGIGIISALGTLGVNISVLVTGLGLTGLGLGLALKDAITNLVAGIMILLYSPFDLDEDITVNNIKGKVIDINLRYVTLKTEKEVVLIPNGNFISTIITKHLS